MKFDKGTYYVGDPCFVLGEGEYEKLLDTQVNKETRDRGETALLKGSIWCHSTAYGDGDFKGARGERYAVDSGMLSVIPFGLADIEKLKKLGNLGVIEHFKEPFECSYKDGRFTLGHLSIDTGTEVDG